MNTNKQYIGQKCTIVLIEPRGCHLVSLPSSRVCLFSTYNSLEFSQNTLRHMPRQASQPILINHRTSLSRRLQQADDDFQICDQATPTCLWLITDLKAEKHNERHEVKVNFQMLRSTLIINLRSSHIQKWYSIAILTNFLQFILVVFKVMLIQRWFNLPYLRT